MLPLGSISTRLCDGVTRREWLRVGGLSSVGLMLPELLAANARAAEQSAANGVSFGRAKSCIVGFLFGAPAHQDIWDLKPDAPDDVRGPFLPIQTSVPGTLLGEHIPLTALQAHRFALVVRSVTHPESTSLRDRYGMTPFGQGCLLARRLVEAGVRLVTVNWARNYQAGIADHWDTHQQNFVQHKERLLPVFDLAYSTLLDDLTQRGLLDETLVVLLSEFGRTPKINKNAGRDHWPGCFSVVLAGAGIRGGLVHGASDSMAAYPAENPVSPEDIAATIYHSLGIPLRTELVDHSGRPAPLSSGTPLWPLFT